MKFDRVVVLSDGCEIYNDKPKEVINYFQNLGLSLGKYVNPADQLLKLACDPEKFDKNLNMEKLLNMILNQAIRNAMLGKKNVNFAI